MKEFRAALSLLGMRRDLCISPETLMDQQTCRLREVVQHAYSTSRTTSTNTVKTCRKSAIRIWSRGGTHKGKALAVKDVCAKIELTVSTREQT